MESYQNTRYISIIVFEYNSDRVYVFFTLNWYFNRRHPAQSVSVPMLQSSYNIEIQVIYVVNTRTPSRYLRVRCHDVCSKRSRPNPNPL